jgi:hypothetical protein
MSEARAPDLYGLAPDEASRVCYLEALGLTIIVGDMVEVNGWDSSRVRVTQQWPRPGSRMDSRSLSVYIDIVGGGGEAGVREPRRPSPPLRSPGVALDDRATSESWHSRPQPGVPEAALRATSRAGGDIPDAARSPAAAVDPHNAGASRRSARQGRGGGGSPVTAASRSAWWRSRRARSCWPARS